MSRSLAEAGDNFSEVLRRVRNDGPQTISVRGEEDAVVISKSEFARLRVSSQVPGTEEQPALAQCDSVEPAWLRARTLKELLLSAPDVSDLDLERRPGEHRNIDL